MSRYAFAFVLAMTTPSLAAGFDWKWYGGVKVPGKGEAHCFYDEKGLTRPSGGAVRVSTKCLLQSDLDGVTQRDTFWRAFMDMSASRLSHFYFPPIFKVDHMRDKNQAESVIMYETLADVAGFEPESSIFYELDCRPRKIRELHISAGPTSTNIPSEWKDVPPEGNGATLISLLCPPS